MVKKIVVMQPYFFPYPGYFRLFEACDLFVFFDSVQFPRRGFVHRNRLPVASGAGDDHHSLRWLTLPLAYQPREAAIKDMRFSSAAHQDWQDRLAAFPYLTKQKLSGTGVDAAFRSVENNASVADYLIESLLCVTNSLGMSFNWIRSSELGMDVELRGQELILGIVKECGGDVYINSPGGRNMYNSRAFEEVGLELKFLPPYVGDFHSIAYDLVTTSIEDIRQNLARK